MSSIASSKIFSKTNPPATAGIPPKIAAYHGIFSEIFNLNDKSKFNLSSSPCEFLITSPVHLSVASSVSRIIGYFINALFLPSIIFPEARFIFKVLSDPNYGWSIMDNKRSPFNLMNDNLYANSDAAESTDANKCDFLSNGFKLRGSTYPANAGGTNTFAYFAWAENPFVTSTGIPTTAR